MKYMGSKRRIAAELLSVMLPHRTASQCWVEPFVGGANMIEGVEGCRIGSDSNEYLIALLKELQLQTPFNPPFVGEKLYKEIQRNKQNYPAWLVGYAGFNFSFGAKFFGGYRRDVAGGNRDENETKQNRQVLNSLRKQQAKILGVDFYCCSYDLLEIPPHSLIYCDPPYQGTTKYSSTFDSNSFWSWCREMVGGGHTVFVSEYNAPSDFVCVWEKRMSSNLDVSLKDRYRIERLFTL